MKQIKIMTRAEFDALPVREWQEDIGEFDSLVILPTRKMHDSGYRKMDFVACRNSQPVKRLSGCSDIVRLDGNGGYGDMTKGLNLMVAAAGWQVDCLQKSGLFASNGVMTAGPALSSFDIYFQKPTK